MYTSSTATLFLFPLIRLTLFRFCNQAVSPKKYSYSALRSRNVEIIRLQIVEKGNWSSYKQRVVDELRHFGDKFGKAHQITHAMH